MVVNIHSWLMQSFIRNQKEELMQKIMSTESIRYKEKNRQLSFVNVVRK